MLGEILEAAERAQGLTRKLLLFSRRNMRREETVDLNGLLERMRETLKKCLKKNVNMKTSLASGLRKVCIDPGLCENVIENLVMNSNEAVSEGGTITIKTANEEAATGCVVPGGEPAPGSYVTITVADDGPGMDRETRRLIFDPFFTTKEANEAEGLGLSIVYGIVKQCRGEIVVESEPGRGTAIKVYLPSANR
jgi:two-component system cell cycle sensor histidine kinase/response regulator CckA